MIITFSFIFINLKLKLIKLIICYSSFLNRSLRLINKNDLWYLRIFYLNNKMKVLT